MIFFPLICSYSPFGLCPDTSNLSRRLCIQAYCITNNHDAFCSPSVSFWAVTVRQHVLHYRKKVLHLARHVASEYVGCLCTCSSGKTSSCVGSPVSSAASITIFASIPKTSGHRMSYSLTSKFAVLVFTRPTFDTGDDNANLPFGLFIVRAHLRQLILVSTL